MDINKTLTKIANLFLYIFIEESAPLNSSIMKKRANQIAILKKLDATNPNYSYNDLVNIVYNGIVQMYNKTPALILSELYNNKGKIGDTAPTPNTNANDPKSPSFWDGLNNSLNTLFTGLTNLGFGKKGDVQPTASDWSNPDKSDMSDILFSVVPWVAAAGIIFFVLKDEKKGTRKKNNKKK